MNESAPTDDALDALLRAATPEPVVDGGFVARTMTAVDQAARRVQVPPRVAPLAPIAIARALVAEERHHAAQARLWRWAMVGAVAGFLMLTVAVVASPGSVSITIPAPSQWGPLALVMTAGALWVAWRQFRAN